MNNIKKIAKMLLADLWLPFALWFASGMLWAAPSQQPVIAKLLQANQQYKKDPAVIEQAIMTKGIYPVINGKAFKKLNSLAAVHQQLGKPIRLLSQGYDACNGQDFPRLLDYGSFQINERTLKLQAMTFKPATNSMMLLGNVVSAKTGEVEFLKRYSGLYYRTAPHTYAFERENGLTQDIFEFKNHKLAQYQFFMDDC